ncbi:MAG: helix-turn-helix domain-containing protein [Flexilinea sp.]
MRTWDDYKAFVKEQSPEERENIEYIEELSEIVSQFISQRKELKLSQRDLAQKSGVPQSSIARIETGASVPQINTLLKVLKPLGLTLTVSRINS